MKSKLVGIVGRVGGCGLFALCLALGIGTAAAQGQKRAGAATAAVAAPGRFGIIGEGTFAGPNGRFVQFFILDVENKQATRHYLQGEFGYSDHRSHISFTTGKILTATFNGDQAAFSGLARIGGKHKRMVNFVVSIMANQNPPSGDTFNISLSNGYSASGNLSTGEIRIEPASD